MSDKPISPLRQRMIDDMTARRVKEGNGILRAETGGRLQAQNAGERSEFGSQTATRRAIGPKLRGFLCTRWSGGDSN